MTEAARETGTHRAAEATPQGLALFDAGLRLVACNARFGPLLGLPKSLLSAGTSLAEMLLFLARRGDLGPGDAAELAAARVELFGARTETVSQQQGPSGGGLEIHACRIPDGGLMMSVADVTTRTHVEAELERVNLSLEARVAERTAALTLANAELEIARGKADAANLDKTRFLAAASHDLLQPLNAARLYTATLVERTADGGLAGLAQSIEASLGAVEEIMTALLDISRLDSGALSPKPAPFPASELLRKVEVEFGPPAREKSIRLRLVGSGAMVFADRLLVGRIVQNLVSNAIKYTRPGGRVLVGCRRRAGRLRLDIIDTGIGFPPGQQALLFAEFSRLEQGARMAPGLGLGLSIVQRLVATLGLALEVEGVEGHGARFSLILPLSRLERVEVPVSAPVGMALDLRGLKLLCVDNEAPILAAMRGLLGGWGCEVRVARSLREISRGGLIEGWLPDLVLMDYHLEQTSGLDAIEWLKQNLGGQLPAVLLTADHSAAVRRLADARGIPILTKPVKPAALRAVIGRLAAAGQLQPAPAAGSSEPN